MTRRKAETPGRKRILIGTCGYSYTDWIGPFYPPGTKSNDMLGLYAKRFAAVEVDSTYYRVPSAKTIDSLVRRTPPAFRFTAKLPGAGTHLPDLGRGAFTTTSCSFPTQRRTDGCRGKTELRAGPVSERVQAQRRDARLSRNVGRGAARRATVRGVPAPRMADARNDRPPHDAGHRPRQRRPAALQDPHAREQRRHQRPRLCALSRSQCCQLVARNERNALRLFLLAAELLPWADRIIDICANPEVKEVFAYFNNHRRGQAVRNAEMLIEMLAERSPDVVRAAADPDPSGSAIELPLF